GTNPSRRHRTRTRGTRLGGARMGAAIRGSSATAWGYYVRNREARNSITHSERTRLGFMAWPSSGTALQRSLLPRAKVVPVVGLRQRHNERPGKSLERPAVLGPQAASATDRRGCWSAAPSRDCTSINARNVRVQLTRQLTTGETALVSGRTKARIVADRC